MNHQRDLCSMEWSLHVVFTKDVTGRMEVLKMLTTTATIFICHNNIAYLLLCLSTLIHHRLVGPKYRSCPMWLN